MVAYHSFKSLRDTASRIWRNFVMSYRLSVQTRIDKTEEMGADYGHNARLAEEQQLLQSIEKHLMDR